MNANYILVHSDKSQKTGLDRNASLSPVKIRGRVYHQPPSFKAEAGRQEEKSVSLPGLEPYLLLHRNRKSTSF